MNDHIKCPECDCNIYLEWKTPEKKSKEEDCCEMPEREIERTNCTLGHSVEFTCPECVKQKDEVKR